MGDMSEVPGPVCLLERCVNAWYAICEVVVRQVTFLAVRHETYASTPRAFHGNLSTEVLALCSKQVEHNAWRQRQRSILVALAVLAVSGFAWIHFRPLSLSLSITLWLISYVVVVGGVTFTCYRVSDNMSDFELRDQLFELLYYRALQQLLPSLPGDYLTQPAVLEAGGRRWLAEQQVDVEVFAALAAGSELPAKETVAAARTMVAV